MDNTFFKMSSIVGTNLVMNEQKMFTKNGFSNYEALIADMVKSFNVQITLIAAAGFVKAFLRVNSSLKSRLATEER